MYANAHIHFSNRCLMQLTAFQLILLIFKHSLLGIINLNYVKWWHNMIILAHYDSKWLTLNYCSILSLLMLYYGVDLLLWKQGFIFPHLWLQYLHRNVNQQISMKQIAATVQIILFSQPCLFLSLKMYPYISAQVMKNQSKMKMFTRVSINLRLSRAFQLGFS